MKVALPHKLSQYTAFTAYTTKIRRQEGYYAYTIWLLVNWIGTGSDRDDQIQQTPRSRKLRWLPTKLTTYQIPNMTEESKGRGQLKKSVFFRALPELWGGSTHARIFWPSF